MLIDVAISGDRNMIKKDLTIEIERMWNVKTVMIGATGTISKYFRKYLNTLNKGVNNNNAADKGMTTKNGQYVTIGSVHSRYYPKQMTLSLRSVLYILTHKTATLSTCRTARKFLAEQ
jgi:hypothetical protein